MSETPYRQHVKREPDEPDWVDPDFAPDVTQTWNSRLACPRCDAPLFAARRHGVRIDACGGCGGVWLSSDDAHRMLQQKTRAPAELARKAAANARVLSVKPGTIACPECKTELSRTVVPPSGVEIDVCAAHGTWFDRSELERVVDGLLPPPPPPPVHVYAPRSGASAPMPTAREIAQEVYLEEQRRKATADAIGGLFSLLLK
jgi:Zn-finger nucleic acid-binding protein